MTPRQRRTKEAFDRVVALILLLLSLPAFALVALWIKLASRGPVLFLQERIGCDEEPFRIYKFGTLRLGADAHDLGGVTVERDPRLIPGAPTLRRFKFDELPQILNVLNGGHGSSRG
jgi:lipopolysaccharide/colanic/teichoic acid biosynthesis glycosyltransferase